MNTSQITCLILLILMVILLITSLLQYDDTRILHFVTFVESREDVCMMTPIKATKISHKAYRMIVESGARVIYNPEKDEMHVRQKNIFSGSLPIIELGDSYFSEYGVIKACHMTTGHAYPWIVYLLCGILLSAIDYTGGYLTGSTWLIGSMINSAISNSVCLSATLFGIDDDALISEYRRLCSHADAKISVSKIAKNIYRDECPKSYEYYKIKKELTRRGITC